MADKIIKTASFWYSDKKGVERTALRGETVDITDEDDLERGERLDAFATDADLQAGTPFGDFYLAREASEKAAADADRSASAEEPRTVDRPGDSDSRAKWAEYARTKDAPEAELAPVNEGGLSRDALREKYGA